MMAAARAAALAALQAAGGGALLLARAEAWAGPIETWWHSGRGAVLDALGIGGPRGAALRDPENDGRAGRGLEAARRLGYAPVEVRSIHGLDTLPEPPVFLLHRGRLPEATTPTLAIVGARRASGYGLRTARHLAREAAAAGVGILSGLARGIDGAAHYGALDVGGLTLAVLGCGPDIAYPPEHAGLQRSLEDSGGVLTEHLPGVPPRPQHFPRRNRILVAMARAVLVVEARLRSGTLTSVRWAADLGRDVLVVPGPVDSPLSEGPIELLREGCTPVGSVEHLLEALGLQGAAPAPAPLPAAGSSPAEERVLALLQGGPLDLDDLVRYSGEAPGRLLAILLSLEVSGRVVRDDGVSYRLAGEA